MGGYVSYIVYEGTIGSCYESDIRSIEYVEYKVKQQRMQYQQHNEHCCMSDEMDNPNIENQYESPYDIKLNKNKNSNSISGNGSGSGSRYNNQSKTKINRNIEIYNRVAESTRLIHV